MIPHYTGKNPHLFKNNQLPYIKTINQISNLIKFHINPKMRMYDNEFPIMQSPNTTPPAARHDNLID